MSGGVIRHYMVIALTDGRNAFNPLQDDSNLLPVRNRCDTWPLAWALRCSLSVSEMDETWTSPPCACSPGQTRRPTCRPQTRLRSVMRCARPEVFKWSA